MRQSPIPPPKVAQRLDEVKVPTLVLIGAPCLWITPLTYKSTCAVNCVDRLAAVASGLETLIPINLKVEVPCLRVYSP